MEPFVQQTKEDQPVLYTIASWMDQFEKVTAGFTSRHGGVSEAPYSTLNCGLHVHDLPDHVIRNRELLAEAVGEPFEAFTYGEQVHGNEIAIVRQADKGRGRTSRESAIQARDGFVTNEKGIVLCAQFADCVPLFFYDPVRHVAGLSHAGWKGSVLNISMATISLMTHTFGSQPSDIRAAIGPSIGVCCYEVDRTVADRVYAVLAEIQASQAEQLEVIRSKENGKYMLNLQELNRKLLRQAGILSSHIEVSQLCTSCRTDTFFSHRREGGSTGRMVAWIGLR
ncbi:peptidoglycan editing factor PgeF [Paenibacillus sp. GCM10023248]|uniref:peptidoglycan editing factor PgeF n=1 Tax=Bacillales TaxID=1385 RepID=UPI0023796B42|nr:MULTISPECIES: peptidoglycan editing factor PgeF [Bacillales]MDD9270043.1 peptidoglycan editing factor PgeF [Paenibacillus sp. MAHUQ-63]MDR6880177.1 YfiH family protein [Bacillus sp. 3255]